MVLAHELLKSDPTYEECCALRKKAEQDCDRVLVTANELYAEFRKIFDDWIEAKSQLAILTQALLQSPKAQKELIAAMTDPEQAKEVINLLYREDLLKRKDDTAAV